MTTDSEGVSWDFDLIPLDRPTCGFYKVDSGELCNSSGPGELTLPHQGSLQVEHRQVARSEHVFS